MSRKVRCTSWVRCGKWWWLLLGRVLSAGCRGLGGMKVDEVAWATELLFSPWVWCGFVVSDPRPPLGVSEEPPPASG